MKKEDLKRLYENIYIYQILKQEEKLGDFGLPQLLPDKAQIALHQLEESLSKAIPKELFDLIQVADEYSPTKLPSAEKLRELGKELMENLCTDALFQLVHEIYGTETVYSDFLRIQYDVDEEPQIAKELIESDEKMSQEFLNWALDEGTKPFFALDMSEFLEGQEKVSKDKVEEISAEMKSALESGDLSDMIIAFQYGLTFAHNNAPLAAKYLGTSESQAVEFLRELSNMDVSKLNDELRKLLGYAPGSKMGMKKRAKSIEDLEAKELDTIVDVVYDMEFEKIIELDPSPYIMAWLSQDPGVEDVWEYYESEEHEQEIANLPQDPEFRKFVKYDLEVGLLNQLNELIYKFEQEIIQNGKVKIYRAIVVPDEWFTHFPEAGKRLGKWWSWDPESAKPYQASGQGGTTITFMAEVDESQVDWIETLAQNLSSTFEDEREITLFKNTPLKLENVWLDGEEIDDGIFYEWFAPKTFYASNQAWSKVAQEENSYTLVLKIGHEFQELDGIHELEEILRSDVERRNTFIEEMDKVLIQLENGIDEISIDVDIEELGVESVKNYLLSTVPVNYNVTEARNGLTFKRRVINSEYGRWLHVVNIDVSDPVQFVNDFMNIPGEVCFSLPEDLFYSTRLGFFAIIVEGYAVAVYNDDVFSKQDFIGRRILGPREGSNRTEAWVVPTTTTLDTIVTDIQDFAEKLERAGISVSFVQKETLMTKEYKEENEKEQFPHEEYEEYMEKYPVYKGKKANLEVLFQTSNEALENINYINSLILSTEQELELQIIPGVFVKKVVIPEGGSLGIHPASIYYYNAQGVLHREDGPAIEYVDGDKEWYQNGKLHREDGPAVEMANGTKMWYQNDKFHREDGPAVDMANGTKMWYQNGKRHRTDGPAVEYADGTKMWYQNGKLHREDGPVVEEANGTKKWYQNDKLHREDGPAVEWATGTKMWYQNGKLHRTDGPAVEYVSGTKEWWVNGKSYHEDDYWKILEQYKKQEKISSYIKMAMPPQIIEGAEDIIERIYELTYKYQVLSAQDYLSDRANIEMLKIEPELKRKLQQGIKLIIEGAEDWRANEQEYIDSAIFDRRSHIIAEYKEELADPMISVLLEKDPDGLYDYLLKHIRESKLNKIVDEEGNISKDKVLNEIILYRGTGAQVLGELFELFEDIYKTSNNPFIEMLLDIDFESEVYEKDLDQVKPIEEMIEQLKEEVDAEYIPSLVQNFNYGLTMVHHNGPLAEWILGSDAISILDSFSSSERVEQWNKELQRVMGKPVEFEAPVQEWFQPEAFKKNAKYEDLGKPLSGIFYHGTVVDSIEDVFTELETGYSEWNAVWITPEENIAKHFMENMKDQNNIGVLLKVQANLDNVLDIGFSYSHIFKEIQEEVGCEDFRECIDYIQDLGFDGWEVVGGLGTTAYTDIAVFDPNKLETLEVNLFINGKEIGYMSMETLSDFLEEKLEKSGKKKKAISERESDEFWTNIEEASATNDVERMNELLWAIKKKIPQNQYNIWMEALEDLVPEGYYLDPNSFMYVSEDMAISIEDLQKYKNPKVKQLPEKRKEEYLVGENIEGRWIHVQYLPDLYIPENEKTLELWKYNVLESLFETLTAKGELSVSTFEKPWFMWDSRKFGIVFEGMVSKLYKVDIYSGTLPSGERFPMQAPLPKETPYDEGFMDPRNAEPRALVVNPDLEKNYIEVMRSVAKEFGLDFWVMKNFSESEKVAIKIDKKDISNCLWYENEDGEKFIPDLTGEIPPEVPKDYNIQVSRFPNLLRTTYLMLVDPEEVKKCPHPEEFIHPTTGWVDGVEGRECRQCGGTQTKKVDEDWPEEWDAEGTKSEIAFESSWPQDLVLAMVESGDYKLEEAIVIAAESCERCMNALADKYGLKWGYPEDSEEWKDCNTECDFCKVEKKAKS